MCLQNYWLNLPKISTLWERCLYGICCGKRESDDILKEKRVLTLCLWLFQNFEHSKHLMPQDNAAIGATGMYIPIRAHFKHLSLEWVWGICIYSVESVARPWHDGQVRRPWNSGTSNNKAPRFSFAQTNLICHPEPMAVCLRLRNANRQQER